MVVSWPNKNYIQTSLDLSISHLSHSCHEATSHTNALGYLGVQLFDVFPSEKEKNLWTCTWKSFAIGK